MEIDFKEWAAEEQNKADELRDASADKAFDGTWSELMLEQARKHEARAQFLDRRADERMIW